MYDRIKILLVSGTLGGGGAERQMSYLLKMLDPKKFSLVLCLFKKEGTYLEEIPQYVKIYDLAARGRFNSVKLIWRLRNIIRHEKPAILFSMLWRSNIYSLFANRFVSAEFRPKTIVGVRNNPKRYTNFALKSMKSIYPWADLVVVNSKGLQKDISQIISIPNDKLYVVENGIDIQWTRSLAREPVTHRWVDKDNPVLISVASLTKKKGYPYLLKAFQLVNEHIPAYLLILGDGPDKAKLEKFAVDLGIRQRIDFMGHQPNPFKYMVKSDIFILASLWEGMPNVVIEAITLGLPVVATRAPYGTDEIIEQGINGILVPTADSENMADGILELLTNTNLRMQFVEEGKRKAEEHFSVDKMVEKYEKLFFETTK